MRFIENEDMKRERNARPNKVWSVSLEAPHIIKMCDKKTKDETVEFFDDIGDAFIKRREMSDYYRESWEEFTEFQDCDRCGDSEVLNSK